MCKLLLVNVCVWQSLFYRISDKLLPFDMLSILILDKSCMNLMSLYVFSLVLVLINSIYFSNVTSTYYMEMK